MCNLGAKFAKSVVKIDDVRIRNQGRTLALKFSDRPEVYATLSAELLRVMAPSTDVVSNNTLVYGKRGLSIIDMYPVGAYAFRITFSDQHDAGIFSYEYLRTMRDNKWGVMRTYITRIRDAKKSRILAGGPNRKPQTVHHHH
eukprot:PhF_6_TR38323/c0_g1_i1/m.57146